jgi:hypothetical protein
MNEDESPRALSLHDQKVLDIATAILDFGQMLQRHCSTTHSVKVEVDDIARRFREDRRDVLQALILLRKRGQASPRIPGISWRIQPLKPAA